MQALVSFVEDDNNHLRLVYKLGSSMSPQRQALSRPENIFVHLAR